MDEKAKLNKNTVVFGIVGLLIGLTIGFFAANYVNRNASFNQQASQNATNLPAINIEEHNPVVMMPDVRQVLEIARNEPNNFDAQIRAGEMYYKIQRFDKALNYYIKAQKIKPNDLQANIELAGIYYEMKNYIDAAKYFMKALEIDPKNTDVRSDLGLTFYLREPSDNERAIREYRKSLDIDPNHEPSLQNLSIVLKRMNAKKELNKTLSRLKKVNPKNIILEKYEKDSRK